MDSSSKAAREARRQKLKQDRAQRDVEQKTNKERQAKEAVERKAAAERKKKPKLEGALKEEEGSSTAVVEAKSRNFTDVMFLQAVNSKDPNALATFINNSRGSGYNGNSSKDHPGTTLDIMNLSVQAGPDGDKGNIQWMLYNALIQIDNSLRALGVGGVVFLFDSSKVHDGGFGLAPIPVDEYGNITDSRIKKVLGTRDNYLELLSFMTTSEKYGDGLAKQGLNEAHGWKRNSKTSYTGMDFRWHGAGRKAHIFHKKGCNWRTSPPDRFGDEVRAEIQRDYRASKE